MTRCESCSATVTGRDVAASFLERCRIASGFKVQSVGELRQSGAEYPTAVPILVRWLPRIENEQVKEDIVRTLSVPWAAPDAGPALIAEFQKADGQQRDGLRWAIANGLAVTADDAVFDQLVAVVTDRKYGKAREMLALAMGNCHNPRAVNVLIDCWRMNRSSGTPSWRSES